MLLQDEEERSTAGTCVVEGRAPSAGADDSPPSAGWFWSSSWVLEICRACAKTRAFIVRDARIETSYKFQFVWSFATIFFTVATSYFVAKLLAENRGAKSLAKYDGDYFAFAVIGLAGAKYLEASLTGVITSVRQAMNQGTLEIMFASPTRPGTILVLSAVWEFLFETLRVVFCLGVAIACFGLRLHNPQWGAVVLTLALTLPAFLGLAVLSSSLLILVKRGDPVNWFVFGAASLVSGVLFPVDLLPAWLRVVAHLVPLTYSLECLRDALLRGRTIAEISPALFPLLAFSAVILPLSLLASRVVLNNAKRSGALGTF